MNPGKTALAKTLARTLDVPFAVSDATAFTQAGCMYNLILGVSSLLTRSQDVGEDVEMAIHRLVR